MTTHLQTYQTAEKLATIAAQGAFLLCIGFDYGDVCGRWIVRSKAVGDDAARAWFSSYLASIAYEDEDLPAIEAAFGWDIFPFEPDAELARDLVRDGRGEEVDAYLAGTADSIVLPD